MSKKLLAAGMLRDFEFGCQDELDLYLYALDHRLISYRILDKFTRSDGTVLVRILQQYNAVDLIEL